MRRAWSVSLRGWRVAAFVYAAVIVAGLVSPRTALAGDHFTSPFASGVVADFNADGRPDLAVANHVGGLSSAYRIDFQLSNGRRQSISFASEHHALRVAAVDVDNDRDIDLVVTPELGREVVGVWLNDGEGHFRPGDPGAVPSDLARLSTTTITGYPPQLAAATPTPRLVVLPASTTRIALSADRTRMRPSAVVASNRFLLSSLSPRPPPSRV